jgi:hypothetical protein
MTMTDFLLVGFGWTGLAITLILGLMNKHIA